MHLIKWILAIAMVIAAVVVLNHPIVKIKMVYSDYLSAPGLMAQDRVIKKGRKVMRPEALPFILGVYAQGEDVKFAEMMVGSCRGIDANNALWEIARSPEASPMERTICLAHLLSRGQLDVWIEITEEDIDSICNSPPHHIVFWKTLLLKNTGYGHRVFKNDTHPERRRFRAVFHECIEMYEQRQFQRKIQNMG